MRAGDSEGQVSHRPMSNHLDAIAASNSFLHQRYREGVSAIEMELQAGRWRGNGLGILYGSGDTGVRL